MAANSPENAAIDRVWYLSDKTPIKKNKAVDVKPWLNIRYTEPFMPISVNENMPAVAKLICATELKAIFRFKSICLEAAKLA